MVRDDRTVVYLSPAMRGAYGDLVGKKCYETALAEGDVCRNCPVARGAEHSTFPYTRTARLPDGTVWEMTVSR